jgi:predicted Fe-S protein YdhL (DUF1289 family)
MSSEEPASPCVDVCRIHPDTGFCRGCRRTLDEIAGWRDFSAVEKREVLERVEARKGGSEGSREAGDMESRT